MITGHIFKALIAVNCLKVSGKADRRSDSWDASGKMSKAVRGQRGCHIPRERDGECKVQPFPSPVNLESRAYTNSIVSGCLLHKH